MAASINIAAYSDALVVLGAAGVIVPAARRFGLSPVLGYLGAGALLGPLGLGQFVSAIPALYWVTVVEPKNVAVIAELGIVFLLFLLGLELSFARLKAMRRLVFGLGTAQVALSTGLIALVALWFGQTLPVALVLGACLALSSTAIVIEVLSAQNRLSSTAGRTSFAVLIAQDLAVVPVLLFISILGAGTQGSVFASLGFALLQALVALAVIVLFGRTLMRPLFRLVAGAQSDELFIAAILFVIVSTGLVAAQAGLSMALGAFVAGLLLAETEYRKAIEAIVEPFKGLLLGIFFFTVGMNIDVRALVQAPLWLALAVFGLIILKGVLIIALARGFQLSWPVALETAFLLGPAGEFAFVGIGMASALGVMEGKVASFALTATSLTMVLIPLLGALARRINLRFAPAKMVDPALSLLPAQQAKHAIVVGHGRVGKVVCAMLGQHNIPFIATDRDAAAVSRDRAQGLNVYYGNAADAAFLKSCGIMDASGVVVTIHTRNAIDAVVAQIRTLRPDIPIISRALDAEHARHLYTIGVTDAVPETIEASLQLSEAVLVGLGVPTGLVIASVHEKRDEFRHDLQALARQAGVENTRSIRPKTRRSQKVVPSTPPSS